MVELQRRFTPEGRHQDDASISILLVRLALIGAAIGLLLFVANVGWRWTRQDHAIAAEPSVQSTPQRYPTNALHMGPVSTGVMSVDRAVQGFLNRDIDAAFAQLVLHQVRCGTLPSQGTPSLPCSNGDAPGAVHEMILSACKAAWITPATARAELETLLAVSPGLYAVSPVSGGHRAVLSWPDAPDQSLVLEVSTSGITSYGAGCGLPFAPKNGQELALVTAPGR